MTCGVFVYIVQVCSAFAWCSTLCWVTQNSLLLFILNQETSQDWELRTRCPVRQTQNIMFSHRRRRGDFSGGHCLWETWWSERQLEMCGHGSCWQDCPRKSKQPWLGLVTEQQWLFPADIHSEAFSCLCIANFLWHHLRIFTHFKLPDHCVFLWKRKFMRSACAWAFRESLSRPLTLSLQKCGLDPWLSQLLSPYNGYSIS